MRRYFSTTFVALGNRDYRLFAFGQTLSVSGTWMQKLAQAWLVLVLTHSGLLLGVTAALQQIPVLFLTTFGGSLADRFPKRTILMWTAGAGALPALWIGLMVQTGSIQIWMVMVAAFAQGVVDAIEKPARMTLVNDIAGPEILSNAIALNNIVQDSGKLVGPALGGLIIGSLGIAATFWINAVSYLPVLIALGMIRARRSTTPAAGTARPDNLRATLRYVRGEPQILAALSLMAVAGLLAYNWNTLVPLLASDTFGGDARVVGLAFSFLGLGGVLGGLLLARLVSGTSRRQIITGYIFAVCVAATAFSPSLIAAFALLFAIGAASVVFRSSSASLVQLTADPLMRGRVVSLYVLAMNGTTPIGGPLQGWMSEQFGSRVGFGVAGAGTAAATFAAYRYLVRTNSWGKSATSKLTAETVVAAAPGTSVLLEDAS